MRQRPPIPKLSDYTLIQMLASALRLPPPRAGVDAPEFLRSVSDSPALDAFPFNLADVRIVGDRFVILPEVVKLRKGSRLLSLFEETPDDVLLVSDAMLSGKDSLFFCVRDAQQSYQRWYEAMAYPALFIGTYQEQSILAAPLTAFLR